MARPSARGTLGDEDEDDSGERGGTAEPDDDSVIDATEAVAVDDTGGRAELDDCSPVLLCHCPVELLSIASLSGSC